MRSIRITTALMLLLVPAVCFAQKLGYGFFTPGVQYAFSPDRDTRPSVFQYGLDIFEVNTSTNSYLAKR